MDIFYILWRKRNKASRRISVTNLVRRDEEIRDILVDKINNWWGSVDRFITSQWHHFFVSWTKIKLCQERCRRRKGLLFLVSVVFLLPCSFCSSWPCSSSSQQHSAASSFPWQPFSLVHSKFWGMARPSGRLLLAPQRASFQQVPEQVVPASCSYTSPEQVLCH